MKRTKQRFDRLNQNKPENVSGCRQFEGEDLRKFTLHVGDSANAKQCSF